MKLTKAEVETLRFYIEKAIIDAEGMAAIGFENSRKSAENLKSVKQKLEEGR